MITKHGFREDRKQETKSLSGVEALRRANQTGTPESQAAAANKSQLSAWSSKLSLLQSICQLKSTDLSGKDAYKGLSQDGTAEVFLDTMNDGQTHRMKLMSDPSVQNYQEGLDLFDGSYHSRSDRPHGGGRGGRGGGFVGSRSGRHGPGR